MLTAELQRAVERLGLGGRRVLVAVSGGLDSVSLAHALWEASRRYALELAIGHVDHGLRGAESEADEAFVRELAAGLGLSFASRRADPRAARAGRSSRDRPTLQEAAREERYRLLRVLALEAGASRIATAHTADDQAETVLLRLLRGSGPDGLAGIPETSTDGRIVRPLLRVSRAEVASYAAERGLRWREDASNASDAYARNRLRHHWLPGLAREFNPRLLRAIGGLAEAQRRDSEWIAAEVEREVARRFERDGAVLRIDPKDWGEMPEALARRLARRALESCGARRHASRVHLERMVAFLRSGRPGRWIELPGSLRLARDPQGFHLKPDSAATATGSDTNGGPDTT